MRAFAAILLAGTIAAPLLAFAVTPVVVVQKARDFVTKELAITPGTVVRFRNDDDFPHQISVAGPGLAFDSDLQDAGESTDVAFPSAGVFEVRCGVHPRMRMTVRVGSGT